MSQIYPLDFTFVCPTEILALFDMGLTQTCGIDIDHTLVDRFQNQFVPAYYVFDRKHELRHCQAGDKGYDRIVTAIERVLVEREEAA